MMNEHCNILLGRWENDLWWSKRVRMTEGSPCHVAFDADWVIKRDTERGDVIGFYHTHPGMTAHYSNRDDRTMKAWVCCLGKPLVCCINGTDRLRAWWFLNDEDPPVEYQVRAHRGAVFGLTPEEFYNEPVDDLELGDDLVPGLKLNQHVKVIKGKHDGKEGEVVFCVHETSSDRLTLNCDGNLIHVDSDEIDFQYETVEITLMMDENERAAFLQRVKEIEENGYQS